MDYDIIALKKFIFDYLNLIKFDYKEEDIHQLKPNHLCVLRIKKKICFEKVEINNFVFNCSSFCKFFYFFLKQEL